MKRWIGSLALAVVAPVAIAQASFTIVRPADASRVREKVHILIPKGSVPTGGYIGFFLDGNLLEATVPPVQGKNYVYTLDTKGRGIADGNHKIEAVLYVDYKEQPRIVDRSSVGVTVSNVSNIPVPNAGIALKYRFVAGTQWVYDLQQRTTMYTISESQSKLGGKAAQLPVDSERFQMLYAVDNAYPNGDGLVRMQALPMPGKDYADITPSGSTSPVRFDLDAMSPLYMRLRSNGTQVFGSIPPDIPMEGTSGGGNRTNLFAAFPLPSLPSKPVRPGDTWPSRFQRGKIDLEKFNEVDSVVSTFPARGEFVGVEWEMGHPCAKIRNVIDVGQMSNEALRLKKSGEALTGDDKVTLNETIWFALDTRQVQRVIRDMTIEVKQTTTMGGSFGGFGGSGGGAPGMSGYPGRGATGSGGVNNGGGILGGGGLELIKPLDQVRPRGGTSYPGMPGGIPGMPGAPGMSGRSGFPGMGGGYPGMPGYPGAGGTSTGRTTPTTQTNFTKLRIQMIFTLQK